MSVIESIIKELEERRSKEMNSFFRTFYEKTIQMIKDKKDEKQS